MIITSTRPYGIIKGMLRKWKKIGIVSCNSCARVCETGGKQKAEELAERLRKDGYDVVDINVIPMVCSINLSKKPNYESDVLVVLACDSGVYTLQTLFPTKKVIPGLNTVGIGARDGTGNLFLMVNFQDFKK
jgi:hypothetical protein